MKQSANQATRVLVVDDERLALWLVRKCLEEGGNLVSEADSCAAAEELLKSTAFDVVVLDYRLDDGFGTDVLRRMRERRHKAKAVLLTAEAESISEEQKLALGIDAVVGKPLDVDKLRAAMASILRTSGSGKMADSNVPESSTGRFTVVSLPPVVSVESLNRCLEKISDHFWLALDMSRVERMEAGVVDGLARLAQRCREGGGRLCVVLSDARLRHRLKVDGLDRDLDVLSDWSELEPAGRRLSAGCERSLLLETVVRREGRS